MKSPALIFIAILLPLAVEVIASSGDPSDGQVLEYGTRKPIAGAIVVALWKGAYHTPWQSSTVCAHVESATTDEAGRYHIQGWHEMPRAFNFTTGGRTSEFIPYKAGYEEYMGFANYDVKSQDFKQNVRFMVPFKGTSGGRMESLTRTIRSVDCFDANQSLKNLYGMYKSIYEEAKPLATNQKDQETLHWMRRMAAEAWVSQLHAKDANGAEVEALINDYLREHLK